MSMLHPCPRCTQALPASAKFCRRCGAAVGDLPASAVAYAATKPRSLLTAGLAALVVAAAIVAAFTCWHLTPAASPVAIPEVYTPAQVYPANAPYRFASEPNESAPSRFTFTTPVTRERSVEGSEPHRERERGR